MEMLQLLDTDGNLIGDMQKWISSIANVEKFGIYYNVVAVLGAQSSGKSTLLNALFDTSFPIMDAKFGHYQTTTGVCLSLSNAYTVPTVVLDVEGTDSKEKEDNYMTFEHRVALFSLAVADCLIINLWFNNLGNSIASNFYLLKTILETNMELFQQDNIRDPKNSKPARAKPTLVFVVRDWIPDYVSFDLLKKELYEGHIQKIWTKVQKPSSMENLKIDYFFNIRIYGLSHRLLEPTVFFKDISNLKLAWDKEIRPSYCTRFLPLESFGAYCLSVWDTIMQQQQLDIPSLKEMVSVFRCQEIKQSLINEVLPEIRRKSSTMLYETNDESFIKWTEELLFAVFEKYRSLTGHYHPACVAQVQDELFHTLSTELQEVADEYFIKLQQRLFKIFQNQFDKFYGNVEEILDSKQGLPEDVRNDILQKWKSFSNVSKNFTDSILKEYDTDVKECRIDVLEFSHVFNSAKQREALIGEVEFYVQSIREKQRIAFKTFLQMELQETFAFLQIGLKELAKKGITPQTFWNYIREEFENIEQNVDELLLVAWKALFPEISEEASVEKFFSLLRVEILFQFHSTLKSIKDVLPHLITQCFRTHFDYDKEDRPRQWKVIPYASLETLFSEAKTHALLLLEIFTHVEIKLPTQWHLDEALLLAYKSPLLAPKEEEGLRKECVERMHAHYKLILGLRDTTSTWSQIPLYFWVILLFFAWNEIMSILSFALSFSPLILITLTAVGFWAMSSSHAEPSRSGGGGGNFVSYSSEIFRFFSFLTLVLRSAYNSLHAIIVEYPHAATGERRH